MGGWGSILEWLRAMVEPQVHRRPASEKEPTASLEAVTREPSAWLDVPTSPPLQKTLSLLSEPATCNHLARL